MSYLLEQRVVESQGDIYVVQGEDPSVVLKAFERSQSHCVRHLQYNHVNYYCIVHQEDRNNFFAGFWANTLGNGKTELIEIKNKRTLKKLHNAFLGITEKE